MFKTKFLTYTVLFALVLAHLLADVFINGKTILWSIIALFVYFLFFLRGVYDLQYNFFIKSVHKILGIKIDFEGGQLNYGGRRSIGLTFNINTIDDTTKQLLDLFKEQKVKASFFINSEEIEKNHAIIQRMVNEGHSIGIQVWSNEKYGAFKKANLQIDTYHYAIQYLEENFEYKTKLARPALGISSPSLAKTYEHLDLQSIGWNLKFNSEKHKDKQSILSQIEKKIKTNDILLFEDKHKVALEAMQEIINFIQSKEWEFINLELYNQ